MPSIWVFGRRSQMTSCSSNFKEPVNTGPTKEFNEIYVERVALRIDQSYLPH